MTELSPATDASAPPKSGVAQRAVLWLVAVGCFVYLYFRVAGAAARQGQNAFEYLSDVFAGVNWAAWLALMVPYSLFFFLIDTAVVWRIVNWFNAKVRYRDLLPIRGSAYIISIVNEQVGKGAMAVYLNRRDGVPGWEVGSSMLFIMFCEFYYLLMWATIGYALGRDALPAQFALIPWLAAGAAVFFVVWMLYFRGVLAPGSDVRQRPILKAFREAGLRHYAGVVALRSPALMAAVLVYTFALRLFGIEVGLLEMIGILPVIFFGAAVPTPMRAAAIMLWVTLFPERPGEMAAFGIVQHNFFIFFNAAIGLAFLRRANRELFGATPHD